MYEGVTESRAVRKKTLPIMQKKNRVFANYTSPWFLDIRHFWRTFSKVITSLCFTTPLNKSRSSPGYTPVLCIPCWLQGIWFFLMNSSISNSLKWLFYLMHSPYSSWTEGASQGLRRGGPCWWTSSRTHTHKHTHTVLWVCVHACVPRRDSGAPVDRGSFSTGAQSASFTQPDCWRTGAVIGLAHTLSRH